MFSESVLRSSSRLQADGILLLGSVDVRPFDSTGTLLDAVVTIIAKISIYILSETAGRRPPLTWRWPKP